MSDRLLQIALHAFPRRFRDARSEEIRAVFADAVAAGDRRVFGVAALADVVAAGWRERWRGHPPVGRYLWYRLISQPCLRGGIAGCSTTWRVGSGCEPECGRRF